MATAADSASSNTRSPRSSGLPSDSVHQLRWNAKNNLSSPWSHVVRGESESTTTSSSSLSSAAVASQEKVSSDFDSVPVSVMASASSASSLSSSSSSLSSSSSPDNSAAVEAQLDSSDNSKSNVPQAKKPAWSKPSNGAAVEVGPVMDAVSWPALSESAKASPKSSSDSLKALSDGSASVPQGPVVASSPQKQVVGGNTNPNLSPQNHGFPTRQKSMKRGSGPANGGFTHPQQPSPPPPPPPPVLEMPQNSSGKQGPVIPDSSPGDPHHKNKNWEGGQRGGPPHHGGNDHSQQQRNSSRRGGGGPHSRGDGWYRRDHDRNNYDWNPNRSFGGRDAHMQQQRVNQRNFIRPQPPTTAPFIGAPPVRPFGNTMMIPDMASPVYFFPAPPPESMRGVPFIHAAPFMILPPPEPQLRTMIAKQIEYYFSSENLCKDVFLRTNMDEQGWVPVSLIANFNRVKKLTNNIPVILESVRNSTAVEVQGDKIRKRNDWMNWPPLSPQSPGISNHDLLANRIQTLELEDGKTSNADRSPRGTHGEANASGSSTCDLDGQSQTSNGEGQGKLR